MVCAPLGPASVSVISQDHLELAYKCGIRNTPVKCFERINMHKGFYVYSKRYGTLQLRQQNVVAWKSGKLELCSVLAFLQSDERYPTGIVNVAMVKLLKNDSLFVVFGKWKTLVRLISYL